MERWSHKVPKHYCVSKTSHLWLWYSVLPSIDATISCRIKKAVVGVTHLVTAFVSIHSSMTFLVDMYSFLDPPGGMVLFSVDDRSLFPVNCVIGLIRHLEKLTNRNIWAMVWPITTKFDTVTHSSYGHPGHYIFILWFLLSIFSLSICFPGLFSAVADLMSTVLLHMVSFLRIYNAGLSCAARGSLQIQDTKNRHLHTIAQLCTAISSQLRHVTTIGKNLLNSNISPPHVLAVWWT